MATKAPVGRSSQNNAARGAQRKMGRAPGAAAKPAARSAVAKPKKAVVSRVRKAVLPAVKATIAKERKTEKPKKTKLVRDSFTMPSGEYELLAQVKKKCIARGAAVKKSEVLRAAVIHFSRLGDDAIGKAIAGLAPVKTGRPKKDAK